jgi:glycosyltransferase involved in cell wall biosynthesis
MEAILKYPNQMSEYHKDDRREKAVVLLSNDLSHPALAKQQYDFSWRINRLRPLLNRGYTVIVVAAGGRVGHGGRPSLSSLGPTIRYEGRTVLISPPILRIPMLWLLQSMIATPLMVLLYCRSRKLSVEAVIAASVPYGAIAKVLNKFLKKHLVVDYGDPDFAREKSLSLRVLHLLEGYVLDPRSVDAVTCIDPNIGAYVSRYGVKSVFLPPGGFWKDSIRPYQKTEGAVKKVVYAGHVAPPPAYRLDLLIEAAPKILAAQPDATIIIVGDGSYLSAMKRRAVELNIEDKVQFLGALSYEKAKEEIAEATVAVQLLNDMCLGTKVVDYFAAGKAVVSSGKFYDSYNDFLLNGKNCILVPPDADKVAQEVILLLSNSDLRQRLGENALETVSKYDWDSQADVILSMIAEGSALHRRD